MAHAWWRDADYALFDRLQSERDDYKAKYEFMVERACNEKLDGYHELGQRAADAENARDEAFAEIERLHARIESISAAHVEAIRLVRLEAAEKAGTT